MEREREAGDDHNTTMAGDAGAYRSHNREQIVIVLDICVSCSLMGMAPSLVLGCDVDVTGIRSSVCINGRFLKHRLEHYLQNVVQLCVQIVKPLLGFTTCCKS